MSIVPPIEYADASPEVRAVYDDIMATRRVDSVNNFWKVLANDPANLKRVWEGVKTVMAPGALDPLVKELVYVAVSVTNNCEYCILSHTAGARAKGMPPAMFNELMAVVALANETNRLAEGWQVEIDPARTGALGALTLLTFAMGAPAEAPSAAQDQAARFATCSSTMRTNRL